MPSSRTNIVIENICDDPHLNYEPHKCDCFRQSTVTVSGKPVHWEQCRYLDYSSYHPICEYEEKSEDE
jgi:hypothetical protein